MVTTSGRRRRRSLLHWLVFLAPGRRRSFWPGIVVTVVVTVINSGCQYWSGYDRLEWAGLDQLMQSVNALEHSRIVLVTIGDDDFANPSLFAAQRPLKPDVVIRLVAAACQLKPAAVGVNIFTDTWTDEHREALSSQIPPDCDVAWARNATPIENDREHFRLGGTAGGAAATESLCSGLTMFPAGSDGVVREYQWQAMVRDDRSANSVAAHYATLVSATGSLGKACGFSGRLLGDAERIARIRFSPDAGFRRIPAGVLIEAAKAPNDPGMRAMQGLDRESQAVVLIGGAFRDAGDTYLTPIGRIPGVEVLAHALSTAKSNQPIRIASWPISLIVNLVSGILIVLIVWASGLRLVFGTALSVTLAVAATLGLCDFLFNYYGYFPSVFVSMAGAAAGAIVAMTWPALGWPAMKRGFDTFLAEYRERRRGRARTDSGT